MTPGPWAMLLLAAAVYRTWRLLAEDELLDRLRDRLTYHRPRLDRFVHCPWCLGAWLAIPWFAAWSWEPAWTLRVAALAALTLAAPIGSNLLDDS